MGRTRNRRGEGGRLRDALVVAARNLLGRSGGLDEFSLRAVAREAGIAAPSAYRHFVDRDALLLAAIGTLFAELTGLGEMAEEAAGSAGAWERLLAVCAVPVRFAAERPQHYAVLAGGAWSRGLDRSRADAFATPLLGRMTALVREILAAGGRMDDPERLALLLWLSIHGVASQLVLRPAMAWPDGEELARQLARRLVRPEG